VGEEKTTYKLCIKIKGTVERIEIKNKQKTVEQINGFFDALLY
jgi:hypothetical protein